MDLTIVDIELGVIALVMIIGGLSAARLVFRVQETLIRVDRLLEQANFLAPRVDRLIENVNQELVSVQEVTTKAGRIADDIEVLSGDVRDVSVGLIDQVAHLVHGMRHVNAAITGARVGLQALAGGGRPRRRGWRL